LTASTDSTARIFDALTGKELQVIKCPNELNSASFSADGNSILLGGRNLFPRRFDINSGQLLVKYYCQNCEPGVETLTLQPLFSPDGKYVVYSFKNKLVIWNALTGAVIHELELIEDQCDINNIAISPDSKMLTFSFVDRYYGSEKYRLEKNYSAILLDLESGKILKELVGSSHRIFSIEFSSDNNYLVTANQDEKVNLYAIPNGELMRTIDFNPRDSNFNNNPFDFFSASFSPDGKYMLTIVDNLVVIHEVGTGNEIHRLYHSNEVRLVKFSNNDSILYTSTNYRIHYTNLNIFGIDGPFTLPMNEVQDIITCMDVSPSGKEIVYSGTRPIIYLQSTEFFKQNVIKGKTAVYGNDGWSSDRKKLLLAIGDNVRLIEDPNNMFDAKLLLFRKINYSDTTDFTYYKIQSAEFNSSADKMITSGNDGIIRISSLSDTIQYFEGIIECAELYVYRSKKDETVFHHAEFSPDDQYFLGYGTILRKNKDILVFKKATNGKNVWGRMKTNKFAKHQFYDFSNNSKLVLFGTKFTVKIVDIKTGRVIKELRTTGKDRVKESLFLPNGLLIAVLNWDGKLDIYNWKSEEIIQSVQTNLKDGIVYYLDFNKSGSTINIHCWDHYTYIFDVLSGKLLGLKLDFKIADSFYKLPNSPYYMCSKDASKMLHYVTPSLKVIGFEQLDPVYNRPDIVLDSIGKYFDNEDRGMIEEYRKSWEKRIHKLGLDVDKLGKGEIAVPSAEIVGADDIAYENKDGKLRIKISATDAKYPLRRFNVFVNEVPLYGSAGISIAHLNKQIWDTTVTIPLSHGDNKIQVSVMNELGLENFKYPTYVNYTPKEEVVSKTYFIGIGVNEFKDATHNLTFCEQDVRDLASAFSGKHSEITLLTNEQVTRERILSLKELLLKTTVNDKVIISCSSHGLLDDSLNFYLATHDLDFEHPKSRGLRYEELEGLLDGIPARQKLLLLDACNSGENDKLDAGNQVFAQNQAIADSIKIGRGAKAKYAKTDNQKFIQINELFVNVRNNTGSVIISAAGGQQNALEGEAVKVDGKAIQNGAFTYCVLEYLKQHEGDAKALTVVQLKQYVEKRVEEITNGQQKPTSRQETMEIDWDVRKLP
jgi:WD40 repeat protein